MGKGYLLTQRLKKLAGTIVLKLQLAFEGQMVNENIGSHYEIGVLSW